MMNISEIASLAPGLSAQRFDAAHPEQAAAQFDALVLELLLRQSGLLQSLSMGADAQAPLASEIFVQNLAQQLAAQMDLGFGRLLATQTGITTEGNNR